MARADRPLPIATRRQLLDELYRILLRVPVEKETTPTNQVGVAGVDAPESPLKEPPTMCSVAYCHASVKDAASDRALGAQVQPGAGGRPAKVVDHAPR